MHVKLSGQNKLSGVQERNRLHRATRNGAWIRSLPHLLNGTDMSQEEFRDIFCLRYGLMPQDIPVTYNGCGKKLLIEHALSCPKGGLIVVRHDEVAKEWCAFGYRSLVPSAITYEPKINSRTVQGERTRSGVRQENGTADVG